MSSKFSAVRTSTGKLLVVGDDIGEQAIIDPYTWDHVKLTKVTVQVAADFEKEADAIASADPMVAALTAARAKVEAAKVSTSDDLVEEITPAVEHVKGKPAVKLELDHDGLVAKLIETDQTHRLVWVTSLTGSEKIQVLA